MSFKKTPISSLLKGGRFGHLLRNFRDTTCEEFKTFELPKEVDARNRHQLRQQQAAATAAAATSATTSATTPSCQNSPASQAHNIPEAAPVASLPAPPDISSEPEPSRERPARPTASGARKEKKLNLFTVKLHFLGDYVAHIRRFGTTDSYSTQLGELAHRLLKRFYGLTNKKDATSQIGQRYSRYSALHKDREQEEMKEATEHCEEDQPFYIAKSRNQPVDIFPFMQKSPQDPAKKRFLSKLKDHLLGRLLNREFDGDTDEGFTADDHNSVRITNNRMYRHATCRVNYTTYDMRRAYDTINPRNHSFVMVASPETEPGAHPFWYASVIGIFHADVQHVGPHSRNMRPKRMDFLWVRWLGVEPQYRSGRKQARLPKLGWVPETDEYAFGFLDPSLVLRGCHLIPAFANGKTDSLLSPTVLSEARPPGVIEDWTNYYVSIFVDRDMYVRHLGIGIGHGTRPENQRFELLESRTEPFANPPVEDAVVERDGEDLDGDQTDSEDELSSEEELDDEDCGYDGL